MLRVSTRGRYGLRAMVELARQYGAGPISLNRIADSQCISRKYLHALLAPLKSAEMVRSERGAKGGYELIRPPAEISAYEVLEVLEYAVEAPDCVTSSEECPRARLCGVRDLWSRANQALSDVLRTTSLLDLAEEVPGVEPL